ncbi:MAG TPA: amidohydrolase family protein [Caldilineaceae bacterium]|nr:amidohydrolase family protein [Caldilineaceae bacterium]
MASELAHFIQSTPLCDTHEHLHKEAEYVEQGPDLLQAIFGNYVSADLVVAGASQSAVDGLLDASNPDLRSRFAAVHKAWSLVRHTGYGEAARKIARTVYGIDEITADALEAAQARHSALRQPGERLRLLREVANLDHVQVDDFVHPCLVDESGPDFFFYDISWVDFAKGQPNLLAIAAETGIEVHDLASLRRAMETLFAQNARVAIAIKSQHAYNRTLHWQERSDREAALALAAYLHDPAAMSEAERLCLGDWSLARGVELGIEYDLPFKIHTGYYAGHSRMPVDYIRAGNLCPLLAKYLDARFVLMHIAYPYSDEMVALAKHYPNVYVDFCWAWSIDPYSTSDFLRRCLHAVPANKLFIFGGDTSWAAATVAYAQQTREWLPYTMQQEVDAGWISEQEALALATRLMRENQFECFRVAAKRRAILERSGSTR